jgi:hypothetical protein
MPGRLKGATVFTSLFLLFAAITLLWLRLHKAPPNWDDSWYLSNSLVLYDAWENSGVIGCAHQFLASLGFKAPLITALPLPFFWIFGRRWHAAFLVNIFAMLVLFGAIRAIANQLRGRRAAWMSVYIAGTLPLLYGLSRWFLVEYPLAACVAVAFWLALIAQDRPGLGAAGAFGIVCGFGLLLKADFPLFAGPAAAWLIVRSRRRRAAVLAVIIPAVILAGPWYVLHWRATLENAISAGFGFSAAVQGTGPIFAPSSLFKYLRIVMDRGVSTYYVILVALAALVAQLRRRKILRELALLALWLAPSLVFVFGGNKDVRYIAPILPAFAIGAGCLLDAATRERQWLGVAALVYPLIALSAISFGWPYRTTDVGYAIRNDPSSWRQDEILSRIAETSLFPHGGHKVLLVGSDRGYFNADNFQLSVLQDRIPLEVKTTAYAGNLAELLTEARSADYFVYKEGGEPESPFFNRHTTELLTQLLTSAEWSELPFGRPLPDGGKAHILSRSQAGGLVGSSGPAAGVNHQIDAIAGTFLPKPVACSNACANCSTLKSSLLRPTI